MAGEVLHQFGAEEPDDAHGATWYEPFPAFVDWFNGVFDAAVVDRYGQRLAEAKATATPEQLEHALAVATRYAAVDTGAIEGLYSVDRGFTRTIATQAAAWQTVLSERGEHVRRAIEDALAAYEYVLDAATRAVVISEVWIRELHALACRSQETYTVHTEHGPQERPLPKGAYKTLENSPVNLSTGRVHSYAPVADTGPEMARLVAELRAEVFLSAHPVLQAAYAHYAYVCVHPFADGNGRVARALASVYLYRTPGIPLVVFADLRNEYLDALEAADAGRPGPFVTFVEQRAVDAIGIVRASLSRDAVVLTEDVAALTAFYGSSGVAAESLAAATRLRGLVLAELSQQIDVLGLPPQLRLRAVPGAGGVEGHVPDQYAAVLGREGTILLWAHAEWPTKVDVSANVEILSRTSARAPSDFLCTTGTSEPLEVWLRELEPAVTESLKLKLGAWVQQQLSQVVRAVRAATDAG